MFYLTSVLDSCQAREDNGLFCLPKVCSSIPCPFSSCATDLCMFCSTVVMLVLFYTLHVSASHLNLEELGATMQLINDLGERNRRQIIVFWE